MRAVRSLIVSTAATPQTRPWSPRSRMVDTGACTTASLIALNTASQSSTRVWNTRCHSLPCPALGEDPRSPLDLFAVGVADAGERLADLRPSHLPRPCRRRLIRRSPALGYSQATRAPSAFHEEHRGSAAQGFVDMPGPVLALAGVWGGRAVSAPLGDTREAELTLWPGRPSLRLSTRLKAWRFPVRVRVGHDRN